MTRVEISTTFAVEVQGWNGIVTKLRRPAQFKDFALTQRLGELSLVDEDAFDALDDGLRRFGDRFIVDWNINVDGQELPATGDGLLQMPPTFQLGLLHAWLGKVRGGIDAPLGSGSPNGSTSKAASETTAAG